MGTAVLVASTCQSNMKVTVHTATPAEAMTMST